MLEYLHNHSINSADALRYRPVSDECKNRFFELFRSEHTPSSALAQYKKELEDGNEDMVRTMADRSVVSDYFWVFHYHRNT